jgi:hypothetical protein
MAGEWEQSISRFGPQGTAARENSSSPLPFLHSLGDPSVHLTQYPGCVRHCETIKSHDLERGFGNEPVDLAIHPAASADNPHYRGQQFLLSHHFWAGTAAVLEEQVRAGRFQNSANLPQGRFNIIN